MYYSYFMALELWLTELPNYFFVREVRSTPMLGNKCSFPYPGTSVYTGTTCICHAVQLVCKYSFQWSKLHPSIKPSLGFSSALFGRFTIILLPNENCTLPLTQRPRRKLRTHEPINIFSVSCQNIRGFTDRACASSELSSLEEIICGGDTLGGQHINFAAKHNLPLLMRSFSYIIWDSSSWYFHIVPPRIYRMWGRLRIPNWSKLSSHWVLFYQKARSLSIHFSWDRKFLRTIGTYHPTWNFCQSYS